MDRERSNPPQEEIYARKWVIFAVTMIGLFMALIDITIVNISVPELQRDLGAEVDTVSWVLNAYNIMFAVLLVAMGRLADQFGRKRFFMIGMTIFTLGSLLCALSTSIDALIGFRILQAVGAGVLAPIALATTTLVFPPDQRGLGLALMAVVANLAAAIGPPLGGLLIELSGWNLIFLINVPIGVAGLVLAWRVMPETYDLTAARAVDWIGMLLIGGAVFCLSYGLVEANSRGWGSPLIVSLLVGAAVLAVAFAASQRFGRAPMLSAALARNRQFVGACMTFLLFAMAVMGPLFLAVLMFVNLWGYSELEAAFAIFPIALMGLVVSPLTGRFSDRVPPRVLAVPGLLAMMAGLLLLTTFPAERDYLQTLPGLVLLGAGMGVMFPAVNVGAMGVIPGQELGLGSGIVNMSRQLGFALGVAVLVAVFTGTIDGNVERGRVEVAQLAREAGLDRRASADLERAVFVDPTQQGARRLEPRNATERAAVTLAAEATRDSFAAGFRVAAIAALLAIPFSLAMRRSPGDAHRAAQAAAAL